VAEEDLTRMKTTIEDLLVTVMMTMMMTEAILLEDRPMTTTTNTAVAVVMTTTTTTTMMTMKMMIGVQAVQVDPAVHLDADLHQWTEMNNAESQAWVAEPVMAAEEEDLLRALHDQADPKAVDIDF
jgi:hypothetical protein